MRITEISREELDRLGDDFTAHVVSAIHATLRTVANDVTVRTTVDDLGVIGTRWARRVDDVLLDEVKSTFWRAVAVIHDQVITQLAQVAAADELDAAAMDELGFEVPRITNELVEDYLVAARNRLVNVGNDVWEIVRGLLIDGMQAGDGVRDISMRITSATSLASPRAEVVARTELNAAANIASIAQVRALRLDGTKTWEAVGDERTRPWHREADGQTVDISEKFMVGGEAMDQPLDGAGSAGNVVNCRCVASFDVLDNSVNSLDSESLIAAVSDQMTGAMLALVPSDEHLDRLAVKGGEAREVLHCTLFFLGEAADYTPEQRTSVEANIRSLFADTGPIDANGFGVNHWNPFGETPSWNLAVGNGEPIENALDLVGAHLTAANALDASGVYGLMPAQHTPWSPHVCMAYSNDTKLVDELVSRVGPVTFDKVRIAFGKDVVDVPLTPDGSED